MKPELDRAETVAGISVFLGLATGIVSLVAALFSVFNMNLMAWDQTPESRVGLGARNQRHRPNHLKFGSRSA